MKRTLSLVLALVMVLGTFSTVFAAEATVEQEAAALLKDLGVLAGNAEGDLMLKDGLKRRDAVILVAKLMDQFEEAKEFPMAPTFKDITDNFYAPFLGWAQANGTFVGHNNDKFGFADLLTAQEYASVLLRVLGYEVEWKNTLEKAEELGLLADIDAKADFLRGNMAVMTLNALGTKVNGSDETLAAKLNIELPVEEPEVPAKLEVESVSAKNLKEVEVVFNQVVDKTSAENKEAYVLIKGIGSVSLDAATLQEDGKTVILTVTGTLSNQATDYKLSVEKIKSAANELTVSQKDIAFKPLDVNFPEVQEVTSLGNKAVKITFTEPVQMSTTVASTFKVDGVVASGLHDVTGRSITITLFNTLTDGEHKLTINNNVKDYANYQLVETTVPFTVVTDTTAPAIAEVKDITLEGATVVFTEDVKKAEAETAANYFWKQGSATKAAATANMLDGKTVRITFSAANRLPGYTTDLFVKDIVDYSGNKIAADSKIAITAILDQTRPEVLTYKFDNDARTMVLTFSKAVDQASFKAANVVIKDKDAKVVSNGYTGVVTNGRTLTITLSNKLSAGTYSFDFSGMKDTTLLENAMMPFSTTIETKDTSKPKAVGLTGTGTTYVLTFDKAMDIGSSYSILNPANYFVTYTTTDVPARTISGLLPESTNLSPTNGNKGVIIQLPNGVAGITKLSVQGVKDAYGNFLDGYAKEFTTITNNVTISKAEATGKKKVVLTMSQPMGSVDKVNFVITDSSSANAVTVSEAKIDETDSTKVNLTLSSALSADAKNTNALVVYTTGDLTKTTGLTGVQLASIAVGNGVAIADKIAPSVKTGDPAKVAVATTGTSVGLVVVGTTGDHTIKVIFDEAVVAVNNTVFAENFKVYKADGVQLVYGIDYSATLTGNTVTLALVNTTANLKAYDGTLQVVFDNANKNIIDASAAKNVAGGFDTANDTTEAHQDLIKFTAVPVFSSAVVEDSAKNKVVLTYSEALLEASVPAIGDFTVTGKTISSVEISGNKVTLTLSADVANADVITVSYTAGANAIKDLAGNAAANLTAEAITNNVQ